jgi:DNA-binding transcriptional LysR family regulator
MTNDQLRIFLKVAEQESFTLASEILFLTQPAVSLQIKTLESDLGVKLFDRSGRRVTLTEAGRTLLPYARRIMEEMAHARSEITRFSRDSQGTLRIGASNTIGVALLPGVLAGFRKDHPSIALHLSILNTHQILFDLKTSEIDIGFIEGEIARTDAQSVGRSFLAQDRLVLIDSRKTPLVKNTHVALLDLLGLPLIVREPGSGTRQILEGALLDHGVPLERFSAAMTVGHTGVIKKLVGMGTGVAFLSVLALEPEDMSHLRLVPVDDFQAIRDLWILLPKRRISKPTALLCERVKEEVPRFISGMQDLEKSGP